MVSSSTTKIVDSDSSPALPALPVPTAVMDSHRARPRLTTTPADLCRFCDLAMIGPSHPDAVVWSRKPSIGDGRAALAGLLRDVEQ